MSIQTISSQLVTKLQAVSGLASDAIFNYENPNTEVWPHVTVTMREWRGKRLTNTQNERLYFFVIRIYQEIEKTGIGPSQAEDNLRAVADTIIASFDTDNRLSNTTIFVVPIAGRMGYIQDQPIRTMEIEVECHEVTNASG